jgi:peroxiredoxin
MRLRQLPIASLLLLIAVAACKEKSDPPSGEMAPKVATPAAAPATPPAGTAADKPAGPTLGITPDEKLGTAPDGFGLEVGAKAPEGELPDVTGAAQKLADLYAQGPTFIVFYRGGWCPFCNVQLHELTVAKPEFDKRGVKLVAISVDQPSEEAKTQAQHGVAFPMLSDSKLTIHRAFKVVHVPSSDEAKALAGYGIDLAKHAGESHGSFAVPAVFMVDRLGVVRFAHVDEDYKVRPSIQQLLAVADKLAMAK